MIDFRKKSSIFPCALTAAFVWGCAYPMIKLGVQEFQIEGNDVGSKTLFAGIRFLIAGLVVLLMAFKSKKEICIEKKDYLLVLLFAFINTTLHYFCFYIGVSNSFGARASILNTLSTFLLVFLSCAVFKDEHLTQKKILACCIGFSGLVVLNIGAASGRFTMMGDGMIILNAIFSALGGILTKVVTKRMNALLATGLSLAIGGLLLVICGLAMGGSITVITALGILYLAILVMISVVGFSLYNQLMQYHPVGNVSIYNSTIPVFGVITSCLLLREPFYFKYILAATLVGLGVVILNKEKKN